MKPYIDIQNSISTLPGGTAHMLAVIAERYMSENPAAEYTERPFSSLDICRRSNGRYFIDCNAVFPETHGGSYVYVRGLYWSDSSSELKFVLVPSGPAKVYMNGTAVYGTTVEDERYNNKKILLNLPAAAGKNELIIRFTKTKAGFGGEWGTWLGKLGCYFLRGIRGCECMEGFDLSFPVEKPVPHFPLDESMYRPLPVWTAAQKKRGVVGRVFADKNPALGMRFAARNFFTCPENQKIVVSASFSRSIALEIFIDGKKTSCPGTDSSVSGIDMCKGRHEILAVAKIVLQSEQYDFSILLKTMDGSALPFAQAWRFAGPFIKTSEKKLLSFNKNELVGSGTEKTYWRLDFPGGYFRLYNDNALFGHWNYPLGVTLYGLIQTARCFEKLHIPSRIRSYVASHVSRSIETFEYAQFDKKHFGGATSVHHLLTSIDSLDDCGSFASTMLEIGRDTSFSDEKEYKKIAEYVGTYIRKKQARLPDGTFFRKKMMHESHNGTLWADDLYMSVPFLCRFAAFMNDSSILDDASSQFKGFKEHLFMNENSLMAHVYDFIRGTNTGVPWGRGNGWTLFSLTELLLVLPQTHPGRKWLLSFFNEFALGVLRCQDKNGMWHQVMNMAESYEETSCTAMFISSFARGLKNRWFSGRAEPYADACKKAWKALTEKAIDKDGNVYGVCRGSEFAFTPKYYSEHLLPRLNDTHGIGIVLLAGVEMLSIT